MEAGLRFSHIQGDKILSGLNETLGAGACVLDYDGDGWMDLFLVNGSGQTRFYGKRYWWQQTRGHALYRNLGNGRFKDVTLESGLAMESWGMGCVSGDLDNDGNPDLLITNVGTNTLFRNNGDGTFSRTPEDGGLKDNAWSTSAALADYDGDGLLDIYIANYIEFQKGAKTYEPGSQFSDTMTSTFDATLYDAAPNKLYRNLGNFKFADVTEKAGVADADGRSLDVIWLDANNDNHPDIYITNDGGGGSNTLFINQGNNRFSEDGTAMNLSTALGSHGITAGDIDNDGGEDLVVSTNPKQAHLLLLKSLQKPFRYSDKAKALGLAPEQFVGYSGWSGGLRDFNNDGWLDLFMVNGLVTPDPDATKISQGQGKQFWVNQGEGQLIEATQEAGIALADAQSGRGAVYADFDNDGDMDVYVAHNNDLGQLLINTLPSGRHWLGVKLEGSTNSVGAKVWLTDGNRHQYRETHIGDSFLSSSDPRILFGLDVSGAPVTLEIEWPDGEISRHENIPVDQYVAISQKQPGIRPIQTQPVIASTPTETRLRVGSNDPAIRSQYLRWLIESKGSEQALAELESAINETNSGIRLAAVSVLADLPQSRGLHLLLRALTDPEPAIRVTAVNALAKHEEEASIRWMLRAFNDDNPDVRIAVANAFAFFFREEEAVVHRKYLAIPYLINQLEDKQPHVRIAAIRALADSERYRAVAPLIALLKDTDVSVRAETARALGLIREQEAVPALVSLLSEESDPGILSQSLIALKRLGYPNTETEIDQLLQKDPGRTLETIISIAENRDDGIVLDARKLMLVLDHWYFDNRGKQVATQQPAIAMLLVDTLNRSGAPAPQRMCNDLMLSKLSEVRAGAYTALLQHSGGDRAAIVARGLKDKVTTVRNAVLTSAAKLHITLPSALLIDALSQTDTRTAAIGAVPATPSADLIKWLLAIAQDESTPIDTRISALARLSRKGLRLPTLDTGIYQDQHAKIRAAALRYWQCQQTQSSKAPALPTFIEKGLNDDAPEVRTAALEAMLSRKEAWSTQRILVLLKDQKGDLARRQQLLAMLAKTDTPYKNTLIRKLAQDKMDPLWPEVLTTLAALPDSGAEPLMWQVLGDSQEKIGNRFTAAKALGTDTDRIQRIVTILEDHKPDFHAYAEE